jgi:proliferating cell nuclear antigen PCNA
MLETGHTTMEIQLSDTSLFRRSIEALKDFLPQAQFHVSAQGLQIKGMDVNHVGFVDYFLSAQDCDVFKAPVPTVIGISTAILCKVLATAGSADKLTLASEDEHLKIAFATEGKTSKFELPTLEIDMETVELPEMSYGATIKAKGSDFASAIKDLALFGDSITLQLNEDGFHLKAEGDVGKGAMTLEPTDDREMTLEADSVEVSYGMKYIQQIIKSCCSLAATMELAFDESNPLRITTRFGKESHFIAYLAPKIQED